MNTMKTFFNLKFYFMKNDPPAPQNVLLKSNTSFHPCPNSTNKAPLFYNQKICKNLFNPSICVPKKTEQSEAQLVAQSK